VTGLSQHTRQTATDELRFVYDGWNLIATLNSQLSTSFVALFNAANGSETARYEYGPFGEVIRATGPMAKTNPFRFSTKYQDDETDLLYYGYRYYSASTGRWISRDPIEEKGGRNLYRFVRNDAARFADIDGRAIAPNYGIFDSLNEFVQRATDCYNKMTEAEQKAHNAFGNSQGYECCVDGRKVLINDFPGVVSGIPSQKYGVLHCMTGFFAHQLGADTPCLAAANLGHELREFLTAGSGSQRRMGRWVGSWIPLQICRKCLREV
jgi:RHS repeat-associated protein